MWFSDEPILPSHRTITGTTTVTEVATGGRKTISKYYLKIVLHLLIA